VLEELAHAAIDGGCLGSFEYFHDQVSTRPKQQGNQPFNGLEQAFLGSAIPFADSAELWCRIRKQYVGTTTQRSENAFAYIPIREIADKCDHVLIGQGRLQRL